MIINHHEIPIFKPCLALIFGIILSGFVPINIRVSSILVYLILFFFGWQLVSKKKTSQHAKSLFLLFLLCGFGICSVQERNPQLRSFPYDTSCKKFTVRINKILKHKKHKKCIVKILSCQKQDSTFLQSSGKILVYFENASSDTSITVGQEYFVSGKLSSLRPATNPYAFDYASYLNREQIYHQVFAKNKHWQFLRTNERSWIHLWINKLQLKAQDILKINFPKTTNQALVSAMVLGDRAELDQDQKDSFINTGAIHVLAVSGLHVGILCLFLSSILQFIQLIIPIPNVLKGLLVIVCIWIFALITGSASAVCRAALMFTLFYLSRDLLHRYVSVYNVIFASAFILLLIDPQQLFKVSFQFSYLAVLSIVFFYPYVNLWINSKFKLVNYLWSSIALGISAQILVFPISIYYFNKFASSFFITSIFVVQLAMVILISCLLIILLESFGLSFISRTFLSPITNWIIDLFQDLVDKVQDLPYSYIDNIWIDKTQLVLIYIILGLLMLLIKQKKWKFFIALFLFCAGLCSHTIHNRQLQSVQHRAFIYDDKDGNLDVFIGSHCMQLGPESPQGKSFVYGRNRLAHHIKTTASIDEFISSSNAVMNSFEVKDELLRLGDQFLAFANVELFTEVDPSSKINYLIVNTEHSDLSKIALEKIKNTEVILDGTLPPWTRKELLAYCVDSGLSVYDVKTSGAKMIEF